MNMDWQPIDTAPKDGTSILVFIPDAVAPFGDQIDIVRYGSDGASGLAWCHARCVDGLESGNPTHWMPLPDAPIVDKDHS